MRALNYRGERGLCKMVMLPTMRGGVRDMRFMGFSSKVGRISVFALALAFVASLGVVSFPAPIENTLRATAWGRTVSGAQPPPLILDQVAPNYDVTVTVTDIVFVLYDIAWAEGRAASVLVNSKI